MNSNDNIPVTSTPPVPEVENIPSVPATIPIAATPMLELESTALPSSPMEAGTLAMAITTTQPKKYAGTLPAEEAIMAKIQPPERERGKRNLWSWVLPLMFLTAMLVLVLYAVPYLVYHWRMLDAQADAEAIFLRRRAELKAEAEFAEERLDLLDKRVHLTGLGFRELVRKVSPQVVSVANYRVPTPEDLRLFAKKNLIFDWDNDKKYLQAGVGSGVIYKPGVILTNCHVVKGANRLRITFASGQSIGVDLDRVSTDVITDLALIMLPDDLPTGIKEDVKNTVVFADSDKDVQKGDWALAIGSPLGLKQTVTQGIISAKGRLLSMLDMVELIQTDAAINPGNSGGPLFDQFGKVSGINVAIASDNGGNQGIGFAIPSNTVKKICEQLITNGEVSRGFLGIEMEDLPGPQLKSLKIDDGGAIVVKSVLVGQGAAKGGLRKGDVLIRINKETLNRQQPMRHCRQIVVDLEPGSEVPVEVVRDGVRRHFMITLSKRPAF
jgi:S1-C subfamily serine protease